MIKYIITLLIGLGLGFILTSATNNSKSDYFILEQDCKIADIGSLNKGVKLKYIESTSEGITRYCLYLNTKGIELSPVEDDKAELIIPYFLFAEDQDN